MEDSLAKQNEFYNKFRETYEKHERVVWELEAIIDQLSKLKHLGKKDEAVEHNRQRVAKKLQGELEAVQKVVTEMARDLGTLTMFLDRPVGPNGISNTVRELCEEEAVKNGGTHSYTLLTALLNLFLKREKKSGASVYKTRVRKGFKKTAEEIISEEKRQNELFRTEVLQKYKNCLTMGEMALIESAFKRRMARHGEEAI